VAQQSATFKRLLSGLVVALVVLAITEGSVRSLGLDNGPALISPLAFQRSTGPISGPGPTADTKLFGGPDIVTASKPVGIRIFFYGGSATQGYHMTPFSSFAGWYQRLVRQMFPDTPIEVINLGAGGEGSRQVVELMKATVASEQIDLFVVYSGNNEYYELRALKEAVPGFDARTELARRRISGSHLYRLLRNLIRPIESASNDTVSLQPVDSIDAEINQAERELGVIFYREHVEAMISIAKQAGVPLLLSTVADQTRSFAFHGEPPTLSSGVKEGVRTLDVAGRTRDATQVKSVLTSLEGKLESQADFHAVATLLDRDQYWDLARPYYEEAEYLDPRPRRSNKAMRQALRDVASDAGIPVCDVANELAKMSRSGITGEDVFIDPCHPNATGHRRIAEILLACTVEHKLVPRLGESAVNMDQILESIPLEGVEVLRLDHFTERRAQLHENRAMTQEEITATIRSFDDGTPEGAAIAGHHATLFNLPKGALAWYDLALERGGSVGPIQVSRGLTLQRLHDVQGARTALDAALARLSNDVEVQHFRAVLGDIQ
jgi:lysophospholipase L1-like esterase